LLEKHNIDYRLTSRLPALAIPSTLYDSLMARLDRLGSAREVAQLAATIGREFSYELLRSISPLEETKLTGALNRLVNAELLEEHSLRSRLRYRFKHALIRDAAYESLSGVSGVSITARWRRFCATALPIGSRLSPNH